MNRRAASESLRSYELVERYDRLPPGAYSVTVKHSLYAKRTLIVSDTIRVEITWRLRIDDGRLREAFIT